MSDEPEPTIFLVDDDEAVRESLSALLCAQGMSVESYHSGRAFLEAYDPGRAGCILLDVVMPEMDGLSVQQALLQTGCRASIVFMTAHGDIPTVVQAMKAGAADFLEKPLEPDRLLECLRHCVCRGGGGAFSVTELRRRLHSLTPREREVMDGLVAGLTNKLIGQRLGISPRTAELHRARVMTKMGAGSLSGLVRMAIVLGQA